MAEVASSCTGWLGIISSSHKVFKSAVYSINIQRHHDMKLKCKCLCTQSIYWNEHGQSMSRIPARIQTQFEGQHTQCHAKQHYPAC